MERNSVAITVSRSPIGYIFGISPKSYNIVRTRNPKGLINSLTISYVDKESFTQNVPSELSREVAKILLHADDEELDNELNVEFIDPVTGRRDADFSIEAHAR